MAFWARVMSSEPWAWQALAASHHDSSTGSPANEGELWLLRPWWGCRLYSQAVVWSRDPGLTRQAEERMAEPVGTWAGTAPLEERGLRSYSRGIRCSLGAFLPLLLRSLACRCPSCSVGAGQACCL